MQPDIPGTNPDFRDAAAQATINRLNHSPGVALADLGESGCLWIPGGRRVQYLIEIPTLLLSLSTLLCGIVVLPLAWFQILRPYWVALPILLVGLLVSLFFRKFKSWILKLYLASRPESFLKTFGHLPTLPVAIEDGKTQKKAKLIAEDDCICLLDADQRRLLIEGCCCRYVICVKDVLSIEPVSGYALSGARLVCRVAGGDLDIGLTSSGHGPLNSLTQAFSPATLATGLASRLNRTLFGTDAATHRQYTLPPPVPVAARAPQGPQPPRLS
jgi:hypothetical protein